MCLVRKQRSPQRIGRSTSGTLRQEMIDTQSFGVLSSEEEDHLEDGEFEMLILMLV